MVFSHEYIFVYLSFKNPYESTFDGDFQESSRADFRIRIVFLIGQTENNETQDRIFEEARLHNDVIQESFLDTYNNLTLKSVMMLKWIHNNCVGKGKISIKIPTCYGNFINNYRLLKLNDNIIIISN